MSPEINIVDLYVVTRLTDAKCIVQIAKCQNCYDVFVYLDVEGCVDGVYTRINGFTCCDSVE